MDPVRRVSMRPLRPAPLHEGDLIGLVAPSSPFPRESLDKGIRVLERKGFRVCTLPDIFDSHRSFLAGEDSERAGVLMELFRNPEIRAIMAVRGGYGSQRILSKLDPEQIRLHPKIFVGYSDSTFLLLYLLDCCGVIPFHGPMVVEMGHLSRETEEGLFKALTHTGPLGSIPLRNPSWIKRGCAKGVLVGGNLTVMCTTLGTPWEVRTEGRILFLEECGEKPYRIDRMLHQLQLAGKLSAAAGLVFGHVMEKGTGGEITAHPAYEREIFGILKDVTRDLQGPVIWGLPVGHGDHNLTLPLGVEARLDAESGTFTILESAVAGSE